MGNRLAPILAIAFMHSIEKNSLTSSTILYRRYIDDIFVCAPNQLEIKSLFDRLNSTHPQIHFTMETPVDGWLPFLNSQICLCNSNFSIKWYRKPTAKNILIHAKSAHPPFMKNNVLKQMRESISKICSSDDNKQESIQLANKIAQKNGYDDVNHRFNTNGCRYIRGGVSFQFPYVSDRFTAAVQKIVKTSGLPINLLTIPPPRLKDKFTSSRVYDRLCKTTNCTICPFNSTGDCMKPGCVYQLNCECGEIYIGESGRPLHIRITEHLRVIARPHLKSHIDKPLATHRMEKHTTQPSVTVTILHCCTSTVKRRIMEAFAIKTFQPKLNKKQEMLEAMRLIS